MPKHTDWDATAVGDHLDAAGPAAVPAPAPVPDAADDTLFRTTARIPRPVAPADRPPAPAAATPTTLSADPDRTPLHGVLAPLFTAAAGAVCVLLIWPLLTPATLRTPGAPARVHQVPTMATPEPGPTQISVPSPPCAAPVAPPSPRLTTVAPPPTVTVVVVAHPSPNGTPSAPTPADTFPVAGWTFSLSGLGPLRLGMPVDAAAAAGYLVAAPGTPTGWVTGPRLGRGVRVGVANGVVDSVTITDPAIRSAEGVGVTTPLSKLRSTYGSSLTAVPFPGPVGILSAPALVDATTSVLFVPDRTLVGSVVLTLNHAASPSPRPAGTPAPTPSASPSASPSPLPASETAGLPLS